MTPKPDCTDRADTEGHKNGRFAHGASGRGTLRGVHGPIRRVNQRFGRDAVVAGPSRPDAHAQRHLALRENEIGRANAA